MAEDKNSQARFSGPYMVQDRDHMSEIAEVPAKAKVTGTRQAEQSQSSGRQQGDDQATRQQGDWHR